MKYCPICYHEGEPLKDHMESQGGTYVVMWWCYNCDCEATITASAQKQNEGEK